MTKQFGVSSRSEFRQLANTLWRGRGLILIITGIGAFLVCIAVFSTNPSYTAVAELLVDPAGGAAALDPTKRPPVDEAAIDTQIVMLTSDGQLCDVVRALPTRPEFAAVPVSETGSGWLSLLRMRAILNDNFGWLKPSSSEQHSLAQANDCGHRVGGTSPTLEQLKAGLKVYQERRSMVIAVSFADKNPVQAAVIVNEMVQLHVIQLREAGRANGAKAVAWLDQQVDAATIAHSAAEAALRVYKRTNGTDRTEADDLNSLVEARRQLATAQSDADRVEQVLGRIRQLRSQSVGLAAIAAEIGISAAETATPSQLADAIRQAEQRLGSDGQFNRLQANAIGEEVGILQEASNRRDGGQAVEQRVAATTRLLENLQRRRSDSLEQRDLSGAAANVFTLARPPARPSSVAAPLIIVPGIVVFFFLGAVLAVARDRTAPGFRSERDLSEVLGIPCAGLIPELPGGTSGEFFDPLLGDLRPSYNQAIRSVLVTALQLARVKRDSKILFVTSSVPLEGKSVLAVSLALSAARLGQRVLLVGLGDHGRAGLAKAFAFNEPNDAKRAVARSTAADCIRHLPNLGYDYLSGEEIGVDLLTFLISTQGQQLFKTLRLSYDCVIVDGPAILGSAEARILASMADEVLLAVQWGETRPELVHHAVELFRRSDADEPARPSRLKAVLTRVDLSRHASHRFGDAGELLLTYDEHWRRSAKRLPPVPAPRESDWSRPDPHPLLARLFRRRRSPIARAGLHSRRRADVTGSQ